MVLTKPMEKFVLHVSGPSCVGKSTLVSALRKEYEWGYLVSYDKLKWFFEQYHRDTHKALVNTLVQEYFAICCQNNVPQIFFEYWMRDKETYERLAHIASKHGYTLISINLSAPTEVLQERFAQRLESVKKRGSRISLTNEALFLEVIEKVKNEMYVPPTAHDFDTSVISEEELITSVRQILQH